MSLFVPGDEVFRLFDPAELDHVCELVTDVCEPHPARYYSATAKSLHDLVLHPLHLFIERTQGQNFVGRDAALRLRQVLAGIVQELLARHPALTASQAANNARTLSTAWHEFIARTAGYRVYADLPVELSRKDAASATNTANAEKPRSGKINREEVRGAFEKLREKGMTDSQARGVLLRSERLNPQKASRSAIYRATKPKKVLR